MSFLGTKDTRSFELLRAEMERGAEGKSCLSMPVSQHISRSYGFDGRSSKTRTLRPETLSLRYRRGFSDPFTMDKLSPCIPKATHTEVSCTGSGQQKQVVYSSNSASKVRH